MNRSVLPSAVFAIASGLLAHIAPAQATSLETWVAGTGTDTGTCPITAPCRTFGYAIGQTTAGGVINVLSAGSFGAVNITKSVSIVAEGVEALIRSTVACPGGGTAAVCVSGVLTVNLRGLTIDLSAAVADGVRFTSGSALHVQDCLIHRVGGNGIQFAPSSSSSELFVSNSTVADGGAHGIVVRPTGSANVTAALDRVRAVNNSATGIYFDGSGGSGNVGTGYIKATVRDSVAARNENGILLFETTFSAVPTVIIDRTALVNNRFYGLTAQNGSSGNAVAYIGDSTISGNLQGLHNTAGSQIVSFQTNKLRGNDFDGTPTNTVAMQ